MALREDLLSVRYSYVWYIHRMLAGWIEFSNDRLTYLCNGIAMFPIVISYHEAKSRDAL